MFNPIEASNHIKQSYIDYIHTSFSIADIRYKQHFNAALMQSGMVVKGPFLEIGGSYKSGSSLHMLADRGKATTLFQSLESVPEKDKELKYERPLYEHQERAFLLAQERKNLVITTGTGSGKTECFLLPILQSLLEEKAAGTLPRASVRAIIIYPMNALANDQMKRLRRILASCPEITFGLYNGDTKHSQEQALASFRELYQCDPLPNEIISREVMQEKPPHILITNYSMLEYMLLRPKDDAVFAGACLQYIVLDEAHVYRGVTGIEVALLMRRLRARISKPNRVQYILTSATLGDSDANKEIVAFAMNLCGAPFSADHIIRSVEVRQPMLDQCEFPAELFAELYDEKQPVRDILMKYDADFAPNGDDNEKLFELMLRSALFGKLRSAATRVKTVVAVANEIGVSNDALVHLIAASAKAVKEGTSLIKARYHFFVRALEGAYITLGKNRSLFLTRREYDDKGNRVFECAICRDCGRVAIAGKLDDHHLTHPKQGFDAGIDYFLIKQDNDEAFSLSDDDDQSDEADKNSDIDENDYVVCSVCGAIDMECAVNDGFCEHSSRMHVKLRKARIRNDERAACPACEYGTLRQFYLGYEAATAVLGTTLYSQLQEYGTVPISSNDSQDTRKEEVGLFKTRRQTTSQSIQKARQFLAFSDSRADAAFFASYMQQSYQEFLRRRGIWTICDLKMADGKTLISVREAAAALARLFEDKGSFVELDREAEVLTDICVQQAYLAIMNELVSSRRASSLVQLGKLAFHYSPKNPGSLEAWQEATSVIAGLMSTGVDAERDAKALLELLILDVVYSGALDTGGGVLLNAEEREYLFYASMPKKIVMQKNRGASANWVGWIPRQRTGKTKTYFSNSRMTRVMRALGWDADVAWGMLKEVWNDILGFREDTPYVLSVEDFDISLYNPNNPLDRKALYRCKRCGRVTVHNCEGCCINYRCKGELSEFHPDFTNTTNHYVKLYSSTDLKPFYIKEHTAQLSRERGAQYQNLFIEKKLNALSSSTTFEMGVDVGSLETVFLRDVPPTPANYVQRAGRAGRSLQSAAYALTYAKLSSHDLTYFVHPEDMISGRIKAPMFVLENEKIIRRHINAVAISAFLKECSEVYDGDNQSELLNSGGYEKLKAFLERRPAFLKKLLEASIPLSQSYGINDWTWTEQLIGPNGILEIAVQDFRDTVVFLEREREHYRSIGDDGAAWALSNKLRYFRADKIKDQGNGRAPRKSLIDFLVRNNVLPKYGFPIDTVELLPGTDFEKTNRPQMQRDLQLAVAEYAPGSQIVADGMLYTSRYINKSFSRTAQNWEYGWFARCTNQNCEQESYVKDSAMREDAKCRSCGQIIQKRSWRKTIEPRRGFIAGSSGDEKPKPAKMRKPERNYKTDEFYIGDPSRRVIDQREFVVAGNTIRIESTSNDSLVVRTQTPFKVCTKCGYAVCRGEPYQTSHDNAFGNKCLNEDAGIEYFLTHEFKTDVARITFEINEAADYNCMLSVLFALLEAMSKELGIERNDIKGCLYKARLENGMMVINLIIYDAVAGGAGHSRRLVTPDGLVLSGVIKRAVEDMEACDCEPSCYKCLRNYGNQKLHDLLNRRKAAGFLRNFVGQIKPAEAKAHKELDTRTGLVKVLESTPLKKDYSTWSEASVLFEHYEGLTDVLTAWTIPLADAFEVRLLVNEQQLDAILLWEDAQCVIGERFTQHELDLLAQAGWQGINVGLVEENQIKEKLGRVAVG